MALAETAQLAVRLSMDDADFQKGITNAQTKLGKLGGSVSKLGDKLKSGVANAGKAVAAGGVVAGAFIATQVKAGLDSLAQLEDATTAVDAAIKATGKTGQVTSKQIAEWANQIESSVDAAFDDKAITASAATLLRYGKVSSKNLRPALQVMTDLAAKTGSVESAATLLARALADPAKAAGRLARAGVILTDQQQKQLASFFNLTDAEKKSAKSMSKGEREKFIATKKASGAVKAQEFLLGLLAKTTTGAAKASAGPYRDSLNILADTVEDAQRALGEGFLPVITKVRDILQRELAKPSTIQALRDFGKGIAGALDTLVNAATKVPWGAIGDSLKLAGQGAKTILDAFLALPPWVQTAVLTGWGLNKLTGGALTGIVGELSKGLIKGVLGITAAQVNIKAATVTGAGAGAAGAAGTASKAGRIANAVKILGAVSIAAGSIVALGEQIGVFIGQQKEAQASLDAQIAKTASQNVQQSIDNLNSTVDGIKKLPLWDQALALTTGGQQITEDLTAAADRLAHAQGLTKDQMLAARDAIDKARHFAAGNLLGGAEGPLQASLDRINQRLVSEGTMDADRTARATSAMVAAMGDTRAEVVGVRKAVEDASKKATAAQIDQFHRVEARLAKEKTDPFRFIKKEAQQGDAKGGILPTIASLVRSFTEGRTPWARNLDTMKNHLANLKDAEAAFRARGDTKTADAIKGQIKTLQGVIDGKLTATNAKLDSTNAKLAVIAAQGKILPGDTRSESSGTRLNANPASVNVDTKPVVTAITTEGSSTRTTIQQSGAATAAAAAAQAATTRSTIAAGDTRSEGAIARLGTSVTGALSAQEAATRATIAAGDTRSEGIQTRIAGLSAGVRDKLGQVQGSVGRIPQAIRDAKPIVKVNTNVNVNTRVSVRDVIRANTHIARYGQVAIDDGKP